MNVAAAPRNAVTDFPKRSHAPGTDSHADNLSFCAFAILVSGRAYRKHDVRAAIPLRSYEGRT